jgi:glycerol-3-phosphate acyltransferase PlsY
MDFLKAILIGYLLGSIPFGYLMGKLYKIDVTKYGSGNIGFTNVLRVIGVVPAAIVLIFDVLKGYLATYFSYTLGGEILAVVGAMAAMAGHVWPIYLRFKGGRAVATGLGTILFLTPNITLLAILLFIAVVYITRYVSLGSILCAIFVSAAIIITKQPLPYIIFALIGSILVIVRHKSNIQRLLAGQENKIGSKVDTKGGLK